MRGGSIEASLSVMAEIQERLDAIQKRARNELQALELTRRVEQAKDKLHSLHDRQKSEGSSPARVQEIEELGRFVGEASIRAGQAVTGNIEVSYR